MRIAGPRFPRVCLFSCLVAVGCQSGDDPPSIALREDVAAGDQLGDDLREGEEGAGHTRDFLAVDSGARIGGDRDGAAGNAAPGHAADAGKRDSGEEPPIIPTFPLTEPNRISIENEHEGTAAWQLVLPADERQIEAYANRISYAAGETVSISVNTDPPSEYHWAVYRLGDYQGLVGREMLSDGPLPGVKQPAPFRDGETGLIEARWPASFHFVTRSADDLPWTTGAYLVKLTNDDGYETYAAFTLRDDTRDADVYLQLSTSTWLAYNRWGGESLYVSEHGLPRGKAVEVSYDRPIHAELGWGAGTLLRHELPAISWMEQRGYDVEYGTSSDVGGLDGKVGDHRLFVAVGHDEYATLEEIERLEDARDRGVSLAFLSGNTMYWQVRYEDGGRTMVCYKDYPEDDPLFGVDDSRVTTKFRDPPVNRPENALLGVMGYGEVVDPPEDWVVHNADHWVYEGTGLSDGDRLAEVVGNEWDTIWDNEHTPEGVVKLASSPIGIGGNFPHDATIYERGGAFVFSASAILFAKSLHAHPQLSRLMENLLSRAGATQHRRDQ